MTQALYNSYQLGPITLQNRAVMAPMTRCRAIGNVPNSLMAEYYAQRAGAGLQISEGVSPSRNGLGYARIPGLFSAEQVAGWRLVTSAVHAKGGRIFAQLMHCGRVAHPANLPSGGRMLAPSAIAAKGNMWTDGEGMQPQPTPQAMTAEDIEATQLEYVNAAANAVEAGFDGVELHGANGYLLEQFTNPHVNQRTDAYGGSLAARTRFVRETAERVTARIGASRVGIRFSPYGTFNDMPAYDDVEELYTQLARAAQDLSLAYVHAIRGAHVKPSTLAAMRKAYTGTFILNAGFDATGAEATLAAGEADLIAFGSQFISNPDLLEKLKAGRPLVPPKTELFYTPGAEGYTDY
jgi:N-ethylmaleimide reductase